MASEIIKIKFEKLTKQLKLRNILFYFLCSKKVLKRT